MMTIRAEEILRRYTTGERDFTWIKSRIIGKFINVNLSGINLSGVDVGDSIQEGCNFSHADLNFTYLSETVLVRSEFGCAKLIATCFEDSDLTSVNFTRADLTNARFQCADLGRADFSSANLTGANLTGANLTEANLTRANLTDTNWISVRSFRNATFCHTLMPDGTYWNDSC